MITDSLRKMKNFPRYFLKTRAAVTQLSTVINGCQLSLERALPCGSCCSTRSWSSSRVWMGLQHPSWGVRQSCLRPAQMYSADGRKNDHHPAIFFPFSLLNLYIKVHCEAMVQKIYLYMFTVYLHLYQYNRNITWGGRRGGRNT